MATLGPSGPFPLHDLHDDLDRRWLHYAFRSPDGEVSMIANLSTLGTSHREAAPQRMAIVLTHDRANGWHSSQFTAHVTDPPWSAFRLPHRATAVANRFIMGGAIGSPAVDLTFTRTGRACTSQCAPFAGEQHLRWQSEPGVIARGTVQVKDTRHSKVRMLGYHERVRGRWGWPQLGAWVFGFVNERPRSAEGGPPLSAVFTLIQPPSPTDAATASVMLWRGGRLLRHFPRRSIRVEVEGHLSRDRVQVVPPFAASIGTPPTASVPARLMITASLGRDRIALDFVAETAARIVNPSELGVVPFSVHEVLGTCAMHVQIGDVVTDMSAPAVVEFAGGAGVD